MIQHNLGIALLRLGERASEESKLARLQEAVAAFDAALSVFIVERNENNSERARRNRDVATTLLSQLAAGRKDP
jgi:hypothetical protein